MRHSVKTIVRCYASGGPGAGDAKIISKEELIVSKERRRNVVNSIWKYNGSVTKTQ